MRIIISSVLYLLCFCHCHLTAQSDFVRIKSGVLFSDIKSLASDGAYEEGNDTKRGWQVSLGYSRKVHKFLNLEVDLSYNERKALEVFPFSFGLNPIVPSLWLYSSVPTSPQSEGFDWEEYNFKHFPNFKYMHVSLLPKLIFGSRIRGEFGAGLFAGYLLNQRQIIFDKEDFLWAASDFEPPFNVHGEVSYHRFDWGIKANSAVEYWFSEKTGLGISGSYMHSLTRVNDTFVDQFLDFNLRWVIWSFEVYWCRSF